MSTTSTRLTFQRPPTAVLDACVVFSPTRRDLLLHVGAQDLFTPQWTARIHEEAARNVAKTSQSRHAKDPTASVHDEQRVLQSLRRGEVHFPHACLQPPSPASEARFSDVDAKDRHVAAAAWEARAIAGFHATDAAAVKAREEGRTPDTAPRFGLVTENLKHFPETAMAAYDLFVVDTDHFLVALHEFGGVSFLIAAVTHHLGLVQPPPFLDDHLHKLSVAKLPETANRLEAPFRQLVPAVLRDAGVQKSRAALLAAQGPAVAPAREAAHRALLNAAFRVSKVLGLE